MNHHVVLVGLMGSGKSTLGRRLATRLGRGFVDADEALVDITDRSISEIFATDGEERFRAIEADVLEELLEHHAPLIIAAGGGVVVRADNRRRLCAPEVTTVWLEAGLPFLVSRLKRTAHRPLLRGPEPLPQVLERLRAERAPLYRDVADIVVDVEPFQRSDAASAPTLAERVAELVLAHETSVAQASRP